MPYISEVEVNGVTYDVKDKEAREELETIDEKIEDSLDNLIKAQSTEPSEDGNKIWIDTDVNEVTVPEIDDNNISLVNTWSSSKINGEVIDLKSAVEKSLPFYVFDWTRFATNNNPTGWGLGLYKAVGGSTSSTDTNNIRTRNKISIDFISDSTTFCIITPPTGYFVRVAVYEKETGTYINSLNVENTINTPVKFAFDKACSYGFTVGDFGGSASSYLTNEFVSSIECRVYERAVGAEDVAEQIDVLARWSGKKIGVLGTSVAFGALATTSYMYEASQKLNFELKMFAVPGLAIQLNSDGTVKEYGSFTATKAESNAGGVSIPDSPITPYVPGGSYNNYYRTYENVFTQENADIDFWVVAVVPNNTDFSLTDWEAFDKSNWLYSDSSTFADHRRTFIGALLFIMNQIYTLNPDARMVFVLDSNFTYSQGKSNLNTLREQWNIPIIDLWGKINTSPKSLMKLKSENGTNNHPSTFAHEIMGNMMAGEMLLVG